LKTRQKPVLWQKVFIAIFIRIFTLTISDKFELFLLGMLNAIISGARFSFAFARTENDNNRN